MERKRLTGRPLELSNIGFLCIGIAVFNCLILLDMARPVVPHPEQGVDYGRAATVAAYAVALVVVGVGLRRRSFRFGYVGGLVFSVASLVHLMLSFRATPDASWGDWWGWGVGPVALLLLLPTRYKSVFVGRSTTHL